MTCRFQRSKSGDRLDPLGFHLFFLLESLRRVWGIFVVTFGFIICQGEVARESTVAVVKTSDEVGRRLKGK